MANRQTRFILKNNSNSAAPFSGATLLIGEPIVNTASGIMMFSGVTTGTNDWTPAGVGGNANFFEVGSNLYDLQIRNKITKYENVTGAGLVGKFLSGTTNGFVLSDISSIAGIDSYVTGGTHNKLTDTITLKLSENKPDVIITGVTDTFTTGATLVGSTLYFDRNDSLSAFTADLSSLDVNDTFVTGFTYNPSNNTFTISRNNGELNLDVSLNTVSGLTVSDLTADRLVYTTTGGKLITGTAIFDGTDVILPNAGSLTVGTGGLSVAGDAIIQGSLTVFGPSISAFTSQLYVEDDNITLNYNPTGSTTSTSLGAGWTIQDGSGIVSTDTVFKIGQSYANGNLSPNTEYTSPTGNANRNFYTQLGDIIIRNTNDTSSSPDGVRVLAEGDILDGGTF